MREQNLIYKIVEYSLTQKDEIIVKQKLIDALQISDIDQNYIRDVLEHNFPEPYAIPKPITSNHIMVQVSDSAAPKAPRTWQYRILPNALDSYYNFLELKDARVNAQHARVTANEAKNASQKAIYIALGSLAIAFIQLLYEIIKDNIATDAKPLLDTLNL